MEEKSRKRFERLKLLNLMTNDLVAFAASKYGQEFFEYIDMNCGAMPEGEYEKTIDPSAPEQFLTLYEGIVFKRFDLTCTKILELGDGFEKLLDDYFTREGSNLGLPKPGSSEDALQLALLCVTGMENAEPITNENGIIECPVPFSEKVLYWKLMAKFLCGIFSGTGIDAEFKNGRLMFSA